MKHMITKEFLYHQHHILRKSTERIGKEFGCSGRLIRYKMNKFGIPRIGDALKVGKPAWNKGTHGLMAVPWNKGWKGYPGSNLGKKLPRGPLCKLWRGGHKSHRDRWHKSTEWKSLRKKIMERDLYTCLRCRKHGVYLEVHHILPWRSHPELCMVEDNCITLCKSCHKLTIRRELDFVDEMRHLLQVSVTERQLVPPSPI